MKQVINTKSYENLDNYLYGNPEMTFFQAVYNRYTNFAIESIKDTFDNDVDFGIENVIKIQKLGDLINNIYLEIILPDIILEREINSDVEYNEYMEYYNKYIIISVFLNKNMLAYKEAKKIYMTENINGINDMINGINIVFLNYNPTEITNILQNEMLFFKNLSNDEKKVFTNNNKISCNLFDYKKISIYEIKNKMVYSNVTDKQIFMNEINNCVNICKIISKYMNIRLYIYKNKYLNANSKYYEFGWVENIGYNLIEYIEFYIDGDKINKHTGEWMFIHDKMFNNQHINNNTNLNKMIGNIQSLTSYDRNIKKKSKIYVPLNFWFNHNYSCSIPIVSMIYSNIELKVKFKNFDECCNIENIPYLAENEMTLNEYIKNKNIKLNCNLFIDYIYLDNIERNKFAQYQQEYAIEQLQIQEYFNLKKNEHMLKLDFTNPTKYIVWLAQKKK